MNAKYVRNVLGIGLPMATLAVGLIPYLANRSELPSRVATHFNTSGAADGSLSLTAMLIVTGVMWFVGSGVCTVVAFGRFAMDEYTAPVAAFGGAFVAALGAVLLLHTSIDQQGVTDWQLVSVGWGTILLFLLASLGAGTFGAALGQRLPFVPAVASDEIAPTMELNPGQHVVWANTMIQRWVVVLTLAMTLLAVVFIVLVYSWFGGIGFLIAGLSTGLLARVRFQADSSGLRVQYGWFAWPRTTIDLHQIKRASVIDVRPAKWGGWGYRGSLTLMKRAAVVLRSGPGLHLELQSGKIFVATVDEPEVAAAVLNAEIGRQR